MADISGTNLAAKIVPFTTADSYSTHDSKYGKGGWREVANTAERDAITNDRRTAGMAVYVTENTTLYILNSDLTTWTVFSGGGGSAVWGGISGDIEDQTDLQNALGAKQDTLVSGTNIKTINGQSIVGSGNISVQQATYIHEQGVASASWTINHNLGKYPAVSVVDSAETEISAQVTYLDENTCIVDMNASFKGKAYLN